MVDYGCMESSAIALFISAFNTISTVILACLGIYGLIIVLRKKHEARFLSAFCVAALLAFAVEAAFFNYKHYLKWFAGDEFSFTEISSENPVISDGSVVSDILAYQNGDKVVESSVRFKDLNRKVTSVFVQPNFNNREQLDVRIRWTDESDVSVGTSDLSVGTRGFKKTLYKALPHENHLAVHTCGNVSELEILFDGQPLLDNEISQIAVNRQIPFYFSGLRLFVVSMLFFAIILFVYKPLRAKAAYWLFEYKFDPANKKQTVVYICLVILTIFYAWFCDYTTTNTKAVMNTPIGLRYNAYLVDALIAGKTNIDHGHPELLLNAERPHNKWWLRLNGYEGKVEFTGDVCYYNGKFYSYYGIVPIALLYLPYRLITGNYLSHHAAMFVFASIAVVFLALLWRFLVKKYMPNARFAFVLLSFAALFFASYFFANVRSPGVASMTPIAGIAFLIAGAFLLLKSVDKENINRLLLFFACLCFALSVGCRPNMVLASILVPAVLWKRRSWKLAVFILIPYIMVAIPLCIYNYVRFDSIFEFGFRYCIGQTEGTAVSMNPIGKIHRMFIIFILYATRLFIYSPHFPFVELVPPAGFYTYTFGYPVAYNQGGGLINFPILFCLLYLFKNILRKDNPSGFYLSLIFFVIPVVMIFGYSIIGTFHGRYLVDCAVFLVLSSLFCAYYWCDDKRVCRVNGECVSQSVTRQKIVYVLLALSIFVGLFLFVTGSDQFVGASSRDQALYRYLEYSLGIIGRF
jgi:hypothetical protein